MIQNGSASAALFAGIALQQNRAAQNNPNALLNLEGCEKDLVVTTALFLDRARSVLTALKHPRSLKELCIKPNC